MPFKLLKFKKFITSVIIIRILLLYTPNVVLSAEVLYKHFHLINTYYSILLLYFPRITEN